MRGANRLLALLAVLALAVAARAEERKPDPLEAADSACAEGARSTADMANCEYASYKRWDAELNRVYAALRAKLDAAGQQALKESQQKWLVYRDAERKTIGAVFDRLEGTMYVP